MSRMCTDPTVYTPDAFWESQGLTEADQICQEVLWQAAARGEVPIHTGKCAFCADLLASFQRLNGILQTQGSVTLAVCPDAAVFARYYYGEKDEAIEEHLKVCKACREDLAFMARSQEPRAKTLPLKRRLMWLAAAAAALIFTLLPWPWNRKHELAKNVYQRSTRYAQLAQPPVIDRDQLMAVSAADHHSRIDKVIELYDNGDYKTAEQHADVIYRAVDDPAAAYLLAMAQYKQGKLPQALESMRVSEAMQPMSEYRCWGTLQLALMLGDKATIDRELNHVEKAPVYSDRCNKIRQALRG
jgi:tetratricopeptide (TPR) repeat protein